MVDHNSYSLLEFLSVLLKNLRKQKTNSSFLFLTTNVCPSAKFLISGFLLLWKFRFFDIQLTFVRNCFYLKNILVQAIQNSIIF